MSVGPTSCMDSRALALSLKACMSFTCAHSLTTSELNQWARPCLAPAVLTPCVFTARAIAKGPGSTAADYGGAAWWLAAV
jgi:hypothetical protein